jgi:hypothetical protein
MKHEFTYLFILNQHNENTVCYTSVTGKNIYIHPINEEIFTLYSNFLYRQIMRIHITKHGFTLFFLNINQLHNENTISLQQNKKNENISD